MDVLEEIKIELGLGEIRLEPESALVCAYFANECKIRLKKSFTGKVLIADYSG
jgi:hypothetical protein